MLIIIAILLLLILLATEGGRAALAGFAALCLWLAGFALAAGIVIGAITLIVVAATGG